VEIEFEVATKAHPASQSQWVMTDGAINQLIDEAPGKLVKVNYQGEPVGVVVLARRDGDGLYVTLEVNDVVAEQLGAATIGPMLHCPTIPANDPRVQPDAEGVLQMGTDWRVREFGALPQAKVDAAVDVAGQ
jgi:hypothetical protein